MKYFAFVQDLRRMHVASLEQQIRVLEPRIGDPEFDGDEDEPLEIEVLELKRQLRLLGPLEYSCPSCDTRIRERPFQVLALKAIAEMLVPLPSCEPQSSNDLSSWSRFFPYS